jgi:hypothetical protein
MHQICPQLPRAGSFDLCYHLTHVKHTIYYSTSGSGGEEEPHCHCQTVAVYTLSATREGSLYSHRTVLTTTVEITTVVLGLLVLSVALCARDSFTSCVSLFRYAPRTSNIQSSLPPLAFKPADWGVTTMTEHPSVANSSIRTPMCTGALNWGQSLWVNSRALSSNNHNLMTALCINRVVRRPSENAKLRKATPRPPPPPPPPPPHPGGGLWASSNTLAENYKKTKKPKKAKRA